MEFAYSDIIGLRRPEHADDAFGRRHPPMTRLNRAKLFAPYAALRGFEDRVAAKRVPYVPRHCFDAGEERELNRRIAHLLARCPNGQAARADPVTVRVEAFVPCDDPDQEAFHRGWGQYHTVEGVLRRVDVPGQFMIVGNVCVAFRDIAEVKEQGSGNRQRATGNRNSGCRVTP